jgi:hypothetical protein
VRDGPGCEDDVESASGFGHRVTVRIREDIWRGHVWVVLTIPG